MSYDYRLERDGDHIDPDFEEDMPDGPVTGIVRVGHSGAGANYTSNVWRMFDEAILGGERDKTAWYDAVDKHAAADVAPLLRRAVEDMRARPDHYSQWNPRNGWGDYEGAVTWLDGMATLCERYPDATLRISA